MARTLASFDEVRAQGGVTAMQVRHGIDDPNHVAVDLEFATAAEARSYRAFLETRVWPNSPHLGGGIPETRLLDRLA